MDEKAVRIHLGLLTVDASLVASFSLKDKRRVVRSLVDSLRSSGALSVAEVGYQDAHTRTALAVAHVSCDRRQAERALRRALETIERRDDLIVNDWAIEWR